MYIYAEVVTPNGASARVHRISRVEIAEDMTPLLAPLSQDGVRVTVNSYAGDDSTLTIWQDMFTMPPTILSSMTYPQCIYEWLVAPGSPYAGGTLMSSPTNIEKERVRLLTEIVRLRDFHITSGVETPVGRTDSDEVSIRNIMGAYQSAALALITKSPYQIGWRLSNNQTIPLDAMGMISMGNAVLAHVQGCYERSWALKAELADAETVEDIQAIEVTTGWPA